MPPKPRNDYETKLIRIIKEHGWQVTNVFDSNGVEPNFSYSIGMYETLGRPDLIILGLPDNTAGGIINLYGQRIRDEGRRYRAGEFVSDLIEGFDALLIDVTASPLKEKFAKSAGWYYERGDFQMMQLVWPSIQKRWPWEIGQEDLLKEQPLLSEPIFIQ